MFGIGPLELALVLVIVLIVFGAKRVPEAGRSLGTGLREFKDGLKESASGRDRGPDLLPGASENDAPAATSARSTHD
jgi:sec-independent protein translocase protein TatA